MLCFICLIECENSENLLNHIKNNHGSCETSDYLCPICLAQLGNFGSFKKHVTSCFKKQPQSTLLIDEAVRSFNEAMVFSDEISNFKELVEKSALELVCEMSANLTIPRDLVFETLSKFQKFITETFIHGLKTIILPSVQVEEQNAMKRFIKAVEGPFNKVNTENKLDSVLIKADLMEPIQKCALLNGPLRESDIREEEMILMPLSFKIRTFFELPKVFEKIEAHTNSIRQCGRLNHFINGKLWKKKLENYAEDDLVIPYFLYVDGAQINNPLGTRCAKGSVQFNYNTFPTIPFEYQSRLENIIVASLCKENLINDFGIDEVFGNVIEELIKLARDGIVLTINGEQKKVFFACGAFIGDSKEANVYLGYVRSPNGNYYCRCCRMHRDETKTATCENPAKRRKIDNYDADVLLHDQKRTGIREFSCFNLIPWFHVTDSCALDNTHNIDLGVLHYNISAALSNLIYEDKCFTLKQLNQRVKHFDYNEDEKQNIPMPILKETLQKELKLKMTASEMSNFAQNLTLLIGDLVEEDNIYWHFILATIRVFELSYLPCYDEEDINVLSNAIDFMNFCYVNIIDKELKPVHHYLTHYPEDITNFGPPRYLKTIRCEGKHKPLKRYCASTMNRINVCYSIGKKEGYNFAKRIMDSRGLDDIITMKGCNNTSIKSKVYYGNIEESIYKETISEQDCFYTTKVDVNGMVFRVGMILPMVPDSGNHVVETINEICDIVLVDKTIDNIFAICKTYTKITRSQHYASYCVSMNSMKDKFRIVNINQFLQTHHYPVKIHEINGHSMFRCKRF